MSLDIQRPITVLESQSLRTGDKPVTYWKIHGNRLEEKWGPSFPSLFRRSSRERFWSIHLPPPRLHGLRVDLTRLDKVYKSDKDVKTRSVTLTVHTRSVQVCTKRTLLTIVSSLTFNYPKIDLYLPPPPTYDNYTLTGVGWWLKSKKLEDGTKDENF